MIEVESDQVISALQQGDCIVLHALGDVALTVRANKYPQKTGSVKFELEGPVVPEQTEHFFPYARYIKRKLVAEYFIDTMGVHELH